MRGDAPSSPIFRKPVTPLTPTLSPLTGGEGEATKPRARRPKRKPSPPHRWRERKNEDHDAGTERGTLFPLDRWRERKNENHERGQPKKETLSPLTAGEEKREPRARGNQKRKPFPPSQVEGRRKTTSASNRNGNPPHRGEGGVGAGLRDIALDRPRRDARLVDRDGDGRYSPSGFCESVRNATMYCERSSSSMRLVTSPILAALEM